MGGEEEKEYAKKTHGDAFVKASWCEYSKAIEVTRGLRSYRGKTKHGNIIQ